MSLDPQTVAVFSILHMSGEQIGPEAKKAPAVKKTECPVGAPQGHRRHQPAETRRLQIARDISDDKALLCKSKTRDGGGRRGGGGQRVKDGSFIRSSGGNLAAFVN